MATAKAKKPLTQRQRRIQLIHIGAPQIGLDPRANEAAYRDMLEKITKKRSTTDMNDGELDNVIEYLIANGATIRWDKRQSQSIAAYKKPIVAKIRVQLICLGNLPDNYADGIAKRMYRVDRFEWLDVKQLRGILTALNVKLEKARAQGA